MARMMPNSRVRSMTLVLMLDINPSVPTTAITTAIRIKAKIKDVNVPAGSSLQHSSQRWTTFIPIFCAASATFDCSSNCANGLVHRVHSSRPDGIG